MSLYLKRLRLSSLLTLLSVAVVAVLTGCGGSSGPALVAKSLTGLAVTPGTASVAAGATQQLEATASYSDGSTANVTSSVNWTSSAASVATVNSSGMVTAVAAGSATITASLSSVSGSSALSVTAVAPTISSIAITPANPTVSAGATQQFTATATYSDGSTQNVTATATWASSATAVATINASGLATAVAQGSTTIAATLNGISGSTTLTVPTSTPPVSITVTPANPTVNAGSTQQFTATATYSDGSTQNVTAAATWSSSATSVATINTSGLATAVAQGSSTITATLAGVSGTTTLTVPTAGQATLTSIAITPANPSFAASSTQQFTATGTYSNGTTGTITSSVTWTSSNTAAVTINATGLATGVVAGTSTITATSGTVSGTTTATVTTKTVSSIAVTPANPSFATGSTEQFTATATYTDATTGNVTTTATWTSSKTSAATINSSGLATGVATGTTTITATLNTISGNTVATITVAAPGVNITTWHVDNNRSGLNASETMLTPSNVNTTSFGKLFSLPIDGYAYAEPLLMSGVTINSAKHNVLYVATEHDSVYAFDADTGGSPLWQVSLLQTGETPLTDGPIQPYEGITSTPVIDPSTGTLYVVSAQTSSSAGSSFRIHALDITTGAEKFGGPVTLNVSVPATNSDSVGGVQTLNTSCIQRAALLLANGNIYMGFGSCHSGWLVAYSASTLQQVGVFNSSVNLNGEGPYASAGGVWMGSGGPVADSSGNVYITTGNGPWDGSTAWGDSVLKFPPTPTPGNNGTMQPTDYFTPDIYAYMDCNDADLAAGGLLLIPGSTNLIAGGKTGTMYLVNSTNLGHESANDAGAVQEQVWGAGLANGGTYTSSVCPYAPGNLTASITSYEIFGTSAYFNGYVYLGVTPTSSTAPGGVRQFEYSGTLTPFADTTPSIQQGTRGTSPFISADGTNDGIVWMIDEGFPLQNTQSDPSDPGTTEPPTSATLRAFSAASYPNELWDSGQNSADTPGYGIKFTSPVVANGKVYISTGTDLTTVTNPLGEIDVYGLK
ncbi:MAG: Ig-like domain-containing protein [Acidobacteriaceae bacterium]